jgi:hypothetical protein
MIPELWARNFDSFTRNWIRRRNPNGRLRCYLRFDRQKV